MHRPSPARWAKYDKLAHVEIATSTDEFYNRLAAVEAERDQAVHASAWYKEQFEQMQRDVAAMRDDLDRQRVTFADHHAAKQEIARLRAELEAQRLIERRRVARAGILSPLAVR